MEARGRISVVIAAIAVLGAVAVPRISAHRVQDAEKHGLPALRQNAVLEAASQRHSEDMARRHFFAHETPDGMGPGERMSAAGYDYTTDFGGGR